jgi:uncharacterized membrane protein YgaE (UPF0421/DUF939 family)
MSLGYYNNIDFSMKNIFSRILPGEKQPGPVSTKPDRVLDLSIKFGAAGVGLIASIIGNIVQYKQNKELRQQIEQFKELIKKLTAEMAELKKKNKALKIWQFKKKKELQHEISLMNELIDFLTKFLMNVDGKKLTRVQIAQLTEFLKEVDIQKLTKEQCDQLLEILNPKAQKEEKAKENEEAQTMGGINSKKIIEYFSKKNKQK